MSDVILRDHTAPAILAALEANLVEGYARLGRGLGGEFHDEPDARWFVTGIPFQAPNGVVRFTAAAASRDERIDALLAEYDRRRVPSCWLVCPSTQPADLAERLSARGFFAEYAPAMAADLDSMHLDAPPPDGLRIETVATADAMATWLHVLSVGSSFAPEVERVLLDWLARGGFSLASDLRFFLGMLDGQPVATSLLFLGGGIAGIYCVTTLPEARRRGIGAALTVAALREGRSLGYQIAGLQSSDMGFSIYQRLGFREYATFAMCFSPAVAS